MSQLLKDRSYYHECTNLSTLKILQLKVFLVKRITVNITDPQLFNTITIILSHKWC